MLEFCFFFFFCRISCSFSFIFFFRFSFTCISLTLSIFGAVVKHLNILLRHDYKYLNELCHGPHKFSVFIQKVFCTSHLATSVTVFHCIYIYFPPLFRCSVPMICKKPRTEVQVHVLGPKICQKIEISLLGLIFGLYNHIYE